LNIDEETKKQHCSDGEASDLRLTINVIGKQLVRSATSVGAHYRAACRARANADFIAKLGIVEEEADESSYWPELIVICGQAAKKKLRRC
jgi:four helix bundle protein